ncbi:MAG: hypothetical protein Q8L98_06960 [Chlamydiales bacterium]|nr:hypothetical protein [Chlamydiales bacterium]
MITQLIKLFVRNKEDSIILSAKLDEQANDLIKTLTEQTQKIKDLAAGIIAVLSTCFLTTAKSPKETEHKKVNLQNFTDGFQDIEL